MLYDLAQYHGFRDITPVGNFTSAPCVRRYEHNPVLSARDIPYPAGLVFNCSVFMRDGRYAMVFRNDYAFNNEPYRLDDTNFGIAYSDDGVKWDVAPQPIFQYKTQDRNRIGRVYDPRITPLDGRYYLTCCAEGKYGVRAALFVTDDFQSFELLDMSLPNSRNTLLFPEKIHGKYYRLERPFTSDYIENFCKFSDHWLGEKFHTWISCSTDLVHWGEADILIDVEQTPYANIKNGPGSVPVKTDRGWLMLIHGVDFDVTRGKNGWEESWKSRYHCGVALLDLENPKQLIGLSRQPLITPEAPYEIDGGYRNNVVFPMALIIEPNGEAKIYYGASDAWICLAYSTLDDLLAMCEPV